jgi:monofunctional biosynthetic peptidoglycan transglycosylase
VLRFFISNLIAVVALLGLAVVAMVLFLITTPRPISLRSCLTTSMLHVRLCPTDESYVKLRDISLFARYAVIVSEDGAFYTHKGIDWFELRESFERNWERGGFARGGSTITQQLAKNVYLSSEKSLLRKAREALIAIQIESLLSKDEILEKYLNVVEFGPKLFGIKNASRKYFSKSPFELTVAEGAFLAFLLPNPKHYCVSFDRKRLSPFARSQMKIIIERLYRFKKISEENYHAGLLQLATFFGQPATPDQPGSEGELPTPDSYEQRLDEEPAVEALPLNLPDNSEDLSEEH